jgi:hypothetical protein
VTTQNRIKNTTESFRNENLREFESKKSESLARSGDLLLS